MIASLVRLTISYWTGSGNLKGPLSYERCMRSFRSTCEGVFYHANGARRLLLAAKRGLEALLDAASMDGLKAGHGLSRDQRSSPFDWIYQSEETPCSLSCQQ